MNCGYVNAGAFLLPSLLEHPLPSSMLKSARILRSLAPAQPAQPALRSVVTATLIPPPIPPPRPAARTMASEAAQEIPIDAHPPTAADTPSPALPKLSPNDFRQYNRMADMMEMFHRSFRQTWTQIYGACSPETSSKLSASRLISTGQQFVNHLTAHHNIEEAHVFPMLSARMPAFGPDAQEGMRAQHRLIHDGLDKMDAYLRECKMGKRDLRRDELKEILDGFGGVLWKHLAEEVEQLGAENMRTFWSKDEIARMLM